jgi:hypothetical protein
MNRKRLVSLVASGAPSLVPSPSPERAAPAPAATCGKLLGLHTATKDPLEALPDIADPYAQKILAGRRTKTEPVQGEDDSPTHLPEDSRLGDRQPARQTSGRLAHAGQE